MKTFITSICALCIGIGSATAQSTGFNHPALPGWKSLQGDEFNGSSINKKLWGLYGDATKNYSNDTYGNNDNQGMAQTYRDQMVTVKDGIATIRATRDEISTGIYKPKYPDMNVDYSVMEREPLAPRHEHSIVGWWSGFLSSRDADEGGHYYPLYSRIEIKARIPYEFGVWPALWLRHRYGGAGTFEIDLQEFFVHDDDSDHIEIHDKRVYNFKGKHVLHQSLHALDKTRPYKDEKTGEVRYRTTSNINDFGDRVREISFDPSKDFHVYGAQIDPLPGDSGRNMAVSFLLDGRVRSVYTTDYHMNKDNTDYKFNKLLEGQYIRNRIDSIWDVAINGGIGGKPDDKGGGILYPEKNPKYGGDMNKVPRNYMMDIDWLRVFKRTNKLLWIGSSPLTWKWDIKDVSEKIPAERFAGIQVGDQIVVDIDTLYADTPQEVKALKLDLCGNDGKSLITLKPEINKNDAQVTFVVDNKGLCDALKSKGCTVKGKNIHLFSVSLYSKNNTKWAGFKQINWGETLIPKEQFSDIKEGQYLGIIVRDADPGAKVFLRLFADPTGGSHDRPSLSSDVQYGNIINLEAGRDEKAYTLKLNKTAIQELKAHGLAVTGKGYYLRGVRIIGEPKELAGIKKLDLQHKTEAAVYTIDGIKVADSWQKAKLPKGIYIVNGQKKVVR